MNTKHVTSKELSDQLKESGIPQESEWYWLYIAGWRLVEKKAVQDNLEKYLKEGVCCSAFHVGELADLLPVRHDITIGIQKGSKIYHVNYWWGTPNPLRGEGIIDYWRTHNEIMVEAMGEMLLYLIKNKIYEPTTK